MSLSTHGEALDGTSGGSSSEDDPDSDSESDGPPAHAQHSVQVPASSSVPQPPVGLTVVPTGDEAGTKPKFTSSRSDIFRLLGPEQCPLPSAPLREIRSSAMQSLLKGPEELISERSLPESVLVSSALAHLQALRTGKVSIEEQGDVPFIRRDL